MLSCCCFCSGKFQSPFTEHLSSPPLLSLLPLESSCLLSCILLLLLLHTASSSNLSSHHRGREHLWLPMAFSCGVPSQVSHWLHQSLLYCRWYIMVSMTMSSPISPMSGANFPPIVARKVQATSGSLSFSRSNRSDGWFGFLDFFKRTRKVIITRS